MVKVLITLTMALVGLLSNAQVSETREVSGFTGIEAKGGIEVVYTQNSKTSVRVEAAGSAELNNIITERKGKTLNIYMKSTGQGTVKVYVSADGVTSFEACEGAIINAVNEITSSKVAINLYTDAQFNGNIKSTSKVIVNTSSGAAFEGKIVTNVFEGKFKNGSNAKIHGFAKKAMLRCESGAACMAGKLIADNVDAYVENRSAIAVTVKESIVASSDDTSSVKYYGSPVNTIIDPNSYAVRTN